MLDPGVAPVRSWLVSFCVIDHQSDTALLPDCCGQKLVDASGRDHENRPPVVVNLVRSLFASFKNKDLDDVVSQKR
jgi:hypothetical protein